MFDNLTEKQGVTVVMFDKMIDMRYRTNIIHL